MATVGAGLDDSSSHSRPRGAARAQLVSGGTRFRVPRHNVPELQMRIGRLARRAQRLGTAPLALRECGDAGGECTLVVLEGEPPTLAGWTLAAVVDHRDGEARLRMTSSAAPALDPRRFCEPRCDHCRLRRRRAATFVSGTPPPGGCGRWALAACATSSAGTTRSGCAGRPSTC